MLTWPSPRVWAFCPKILRGQTCHQRRWQHHWWSVHVLSFSSWPCHSLHLPSWAATRSNSCLEYQNRASPLCLVNGWYMGSSTNEHFHETIQSERRPTILINSQTFLSDRPCHAPVSVSEALVLCSCSYSQWWPRSPSSSSLSRVGRLVTLSR